MTQYRKPLLEAIEQDGVEASTDAKNALSQYGLIDQAGKVRLYALKSDSKVAEAHRTLGARFGQQLMTHLDVTKVADVLDVPPGVAFVVAYHEICWQLLENLAEGKDLEVPQILVHAGREPKEAYQLVYAVIEVPKMDRG